MIAAWLPKWMRRNSSSSSSSLRLPWRASSYNVCLQGGEGMGSTTNQRKSSPLVGGKPAPPTISHHTPLLPWKLCSWPAPTPSLEGAPSGQTEPSEAHVWVLWQEGDVLGFSSLHYILAAHMSLTQEPRGRQRRTEVTNFAPFFFFFFLNFYFFLL